MPRWPKMSPLTDEQRDFAAQHTPLVHMVVNRYKDWLLRLGIDLDDAYSAGCIGLCRAAKRFDPKRGIKPSTYLYHGIVFGLRIVTDKRPRARQRNRPLPQDCYGVPDLMDSDAMPEPSHVENVRDALTRLDPEDQALIRERYWGGRHMAAIAEELHLSKQAVCYRLRRAEQRLKEILERDA